MLGTNDPGGLPNRGRGNSFTAAKECSGVKGKEDQEKLGSTDVASGGDKDETIVRGDTEHADSIHVLPVGKARYRCNPPLPLLSTARDGNTKENGSAGASAEERAIAEAKKTRVSFEPPVTKATLSELDVPRIIKNPKLRHDINFDPDLHFRPNLDGEKGRRKAQRAAEFWNSLRSQLQAFMEDKAAFETRFGDSVWCLPMTLKAIGEILGTLVPPEDRSVVEETLNVDLLMQQFSKGVADLEKLARWLSQTLKTHCAPMRDEWVDEMVNQLVNGNCYRDISMLVQGLQTLLGVLEAMKLDVANHQIRCLRPMLIDDTIGFEQKHILDLFSTGAVDVVAAYRWFRAAKSLPDHPEALESSLQGDMWVFFKGFASLLMPSKVGTKIPDTFMFDEERISKLRSDVLDSVNLEICVRLFRDFRNEPRAAGQSPPSPILVAALPVISSEPDSSDFHRIIFPPPDSNRVSSSYIAKYPGQHVDWVSASCVSPRTLRPPAGRAFYSSPSSPCSPSQTESSLSAEGSLRSSILAIIEDTSGESRWSQNCSAIALQILRSCPGLWHLSNFEKKLEKRLQFHLSNTSSPNFLACESHVLSELYPFLLDYITRYAQLTLTQLFEVVTTSRVAPFQPSAPYRTLQDVSKQMAHIGILHWRVWAPLLYLDNPDADDPSAISPADDRERNSKPSDENAKTLSERRSPPKQGSTSESIPTQS